MNQVQIRQLALFAFGSIVALSLIALGVSLSRHNTGQLQFNLSPSDAKVSSDGHGISLNSNGEVRVSATHHTIIISRTDFRSEIIEVNVGIGSYTTYPIALEPLNNTGRQVLTRDNKAFLRESIAAAQDRAKGASQITASPIIGKLPYVDAHFRIDYGVSRKYPGEASAVGIYITADGPDYRDWALDWIRRQGYDPSDMELIFR